MEREKKMYREMKRLRKGTAATSKTGATSDGGSSSSEELNFDNAELHGKLMTNKELQEQLKQKRTKKVRQSLKTQALGSYDERLDRMFPIMTLT